MNSHNNNNNNIIHGDCLEKLVDIESESIDCIVTDPPYGYSFMNKDWDKAVVSVDIWKECLRVLKHGAFAFIMSSPRQDVLSRMIVNLQDAGFRTDFTSIYWTYSQGFPKAMNIAKNISKVVDNIDNKIKNCQYLNNLNNAKDVINQFQKLYSEVGIPINSNDFVVLNVLQNTEVKNKQENVQIVENQLSVHQVISNQLFIVVENVEHLQQQFRLTVRIVEKNLEGQNLLHNPIKIIVQDNVLITECGRILSKIKGEEVSKIELGNLKLLNNLDTNVLYAELIEIWKHIILNQLKNSLNLDIISIMECVSVMTVITIKSTMECLITETVNTLVKRLKDEVKKYEGGFAGLQVKPALETILIVMKPLSEKSFVDQALLNQKGITWLDDCRIPFQDENDIYHRTTPRYRDIRGGKYNDTEKWINLGEKHGNQKGRFPANLIVSDDSLNDGKIRKGSPVGFKGELLSPEKGWNNHNMKRIPYQDYNDSGSYSRYFDLDKWYEAQFIITPKASASERNKGLENTPLKIGGGMEATECQRMLTGSGNIRNNLKHNHHPTVKPLKLMSYLITMGSRENDIILDPFCGSGTTCIAAFQLHRNFIGIEKELEYVEITNKRLEPYLKQQKLL